MRSIHLERLERIRHMRERGSMNFGMPYMGSKNSIAQKIVDFLPRAEHFYDLFGGGGAITHCAYLSNHYKYIHYNELEPLVYKGFQMAINGEFKDEKRWISREDFNALKDSEPYVAICFSFGNCLKRYMYNENVEPIKKAFHYAICFNDYSMLDEYLGEYKVRLKEHEIFNRRLELQRYLTKLYRSKVLDESITRNINAINDDHPRIVNMIEPLERQNHLNEICDSINHVGGNVRSVVENIEKTERIKSEYDATCTEGDNVHESFHNIICTNKSYEQVQIEPNSVIYCDPPYKGTETYKQDFNHDKFYEWCLQQKNIYISEYDMPSDFKCIFEIEKQKDFGSHSSGTTIEKIFTPRNNPYYRELKHFESEDW